MNGNESKPIDNFDTLLTLALHRDYCKKIYILDIVIWK